MVLHLSNQNTQFKPIQAMISITNLTGSKAVNISTDSTGKIRAVYVQVYNGDQQVIEFKTFSTKGRAEKWANSILN